MQCARRAKTRRAVVTGEGPARAAGGHLSKCRVVSTRAALTRGELSLGSGAGNVGSLPALVIVSGHLTRQSSADHKAKSPAGGLAAVRRLRRLSSIAPTNAVRRNRIAAVRLACTARTSSKIAEDRRQARRLSSHLDLLGTARLLGRRAAISREFARKRSRAVHPTPTLWAAGKLPTAA